MSLCIVQPPEETQQEMEGCKFRPGCTPYSVRLLNVPVSKSRTFLQVRLPALKLEVNHALPNRGHRKCLPTLVNPAARGDLLGGEGEGCLFPKEPRVAYKAEISISSSECVPEFRKASNKS